MAAPLKLPLLHKNSFLWTPLYCLIDEGPLGTTLYWNLWFFSGYNSLVPSNWPRWPFPRMLVSSEKVWWSAGSDERYADQLLRELSLMKFTNKKNFNQEHFTKSRLSSTTLPPNALLDTKDFCKKTKQKRDKIIWDMVPITGLCLIDIFLNRKMALREWKITKKVDRLFVCVCIPYYKEV